MARVKAGGHSRHPEHVAGICRGRTGATPDTDDPRAALRLGGGDSPERTAGTARTGSGDIFPEAAALVNVTGESGLKRGECQQRVMTETESSGASVAPADVAPELYEEDAE